MSDLENDVNASGAAGQQAQASVEEAAAATGFEKLPWTKQLAKNMQQLLELAKKRGRTDSADRTWYVDNPHPKLGKKGMWRIYAVLAKAPFNVVSYTPLRKLDPVAQPHRRGRASRFFIPNGQALYDWLSWKLATGELPVGTVRTRRVPRTKLSKPPKPQLAVELEKEVCSLKTALEGLEQRSVAVLQTEQARQVIESLIKNREEQINKAIGAIKEKLQELERQQLTPPQAQLLEWLGEFNLRAGASIVEQLTEVIEQAPLHAFYKGGARWVQQVKQFLDLSARLGKEDPKLVDFVNQLEKLFTNPEELKIEIARKQMEVFVQDPTGAVHHFKTMQELANARRKERISK